MFLFNRYKPEDNEFIGVLAEGNDLAEGERATFLNTHDRIQFKIKALTKGAPSDFYVGYIDRIVNNEGLSPSSLINDSGFIERARISNEFSEKVKDKFFVFTQQMQFDEHFARIGQAILMSNCQQVYINSKSILYAVPLYSPIPYTKDWAEKQGVPLVRTYKNFDEFVELIKKKHSLGRVVHYQCPSKYPEYLLWQDDEKFLAIGPFISGTDANDCAYTYDWDNLKQIDVSSYINYCIDNEYNPTVMQIEEKAYYKILDQLKSDNVDSITETISPTLDFEVADPEMIIEVVETKTMESFFENPIAPERSEQSFLQLFRAHCISKSLFYDEKDLLNFHTSVKTGSIVVLAGMSGTGKSALVDAYASALGLNTEDKDQFLIIPVRPSWTDDSDLLGYVDLVHRVYRPSSTGLISHLLEASRNKEQLYIVCLDEMNLARVEHYFSQFLSILEKKPGQRRLHLYDDEYTGNLYNAKEYPPYIDIEDNVKFIGTVNIDESTYHFADKVLDRANIINLDVINFKLWDDSGKRPPKGGRWSKTEYDKFITKVEEKNTELREFLWDLHCLLHKTNANFGVGPRIVVSIEKFLANRPDYDETISLSLSEAIDLQIKQRIFTKLRGPQEQFGEMLSDDLQKDTILSLFEKYKHLSSFSISRKTLQQKNKELEIYGYCL